MKPEIVNPGKPLLEADLAAVETKFGFRFPETYRAFLLCHNGGEPRPEAYRFGGSKRFSEVCRFFFGIKTGRRSDDLEEALSHVWNPDEPRLPKRLVPIAEDPFGNLVCISVRGKDAGAVYFWDHEEELGQEVTAEGVDDAAVTLIAPSFDEFLEQFKPEKKAKGGKNTWDRMIRNGDVEGFKRWLDGGGDPRAEKRGETPLIVAAEAGKCEVVEELMRRGIPLDEVVRTVETSQAWEVLKWLARTHQERIRGKLKPWTLQGALESTTDLEVIEAILDAGVSIEADLQRGKPLYHAVDTIADPEVVKLLLRRGAKPGVPAKNGGIALGRAICRKKLETAKILMEAGENLYYQPQNGISEADQRCLVQMAELEKRDLKNENAEWIAMQRQRVENNRIKSPFEDLHIFPDKRFNAEILAHAEKLGQKPLRTED